MLKARAAVKSDEVVQGFTHSGLENTELSQKWRLSNFSGPTVVLLDCPHHEKVSPYI